MHADGERRTVFAYISFAVLTMIWETGRKGTAERNDDKDKPIRVKENV